MAEVEIRITQTGSASPSGAPGGGGAPAPGAPPGEDPAARAAREAAAAAERERKKAEQERQQLISRIGTMSMAAAGGLKMLGAALKAGKMDGEMLATSIDAASMALAGLGPYGMMAAGGLQAAKFAADRLGFSLNDMVDDANKVTDAFGGIQARLEATAKYGKMLEGLDIKQSLALIQGAAGIADLGPGLGNQVMDDPTTIFKYTVKKRPKGTGKPVEALPISEMMMSGMSAGEDAAYWARAQLGALQPRQTQHEVLAGFGTGQDGKTYQQRMEEAQRAATIKAQMEMGQRVQEFDAQNKLNDYEQSGLGQFAAAFSNDATLMSEAGKIAASGMQTMADGIGQLAAEAILGGDLSAKSFQRMAGGMLAATGQMAISQGTYFEILAGVAALGLPIPGIGLVSAGGLASSGAALIGFGIGELALARSMGAGSGGGGKGGSSGGGAGGGPKDLAANTGNPFAGIGLQPQSFTLYLRPDLLTDAVIETSRGREGRPGLQRVSVERS